MPRQNPPIFDPLVSLNRNTEQRGYGLVSMGDVIERVGLLERRIADLESAPGTAFTIEDVIDAVIDRLGLLQDPLTSIDHVKSLVLYGSAVKGTTTATTVTSTTGTTITSFNLGPLLDGVPYAVFGVAGMAANSDPARFIYAMIRIVNTGSGVDGMQTGTAGGERYLSAPYGTIVWGTGDTINVAARSRLSGAGTGSINDADVWAIAIPLYLFSFRALLQ